MTNRYCMFCEKSVAGSECHAALTEGVRTYVAVTGLLPCELVDIDAMAARIRKTIADHDAAELAAETKAKR